MSKCINVTQGLSCECEECKEIQEKMKKGLTPLQELTEMKEACVDEMHDYIVDNLPSGTLSNYLRLTTIICGLDYQIDEEVEKELARYEQSKERV